jgi:hypothetical protein
MALPFRRGYDLQLAWFLTAALGESASPKMHLSRLIRRAIDELRGVVYPSDAVASWGAPTGLDSGEPRWRR